MKVALALVMALAACEPVNQDYAAYPSLDVSPLPDAAEPPPGPWQEAFQSYKAGQPKEVIKILSAQRPVTLLEKAWHRWLLGEAYISIGADEKGTQLLWANYEELRDARPAAEQGRSRILARGLSTLGRQLTRQGNLDKAYALHQLQWLYMRRLGTHQERLVALMNLDDTARLMRNYFASEQWLREALQVARELPEGLEKQRELLMVWRRVALSMSEVLRFPEAEGAARESRRISQIFDTATGHREHREIEAIAAQAEIFAAWARITEPQNPDAAKPYAAKSRQAAVDALMLAEQQGLSGPIRADLEQTMRPYCGSSCTRPSAQTTP